MVTISAACYQDHMSRRTETWQSIAQGSGSLPAPVILSRLDYNEVGQLWHKNLHSEDYNNFIEGLTYNYNPRGWLSSLSSAKLGEQLYYETTNLTGSQANWNGNISEAWYNTPTAGNTQFYYKYDELNRLTAG